MGELVVVGAGWGSEAVGEGGAFLVGEEETASGFDLSGVLKGDLKGWDRVFVAVFRRRRFEDWMGDMMDRARCRVLKRDCEIHNSWDLRVVIRSDRIGASDALRVSTCLRRQSYLVSRVKNQYIDNRN